MDWSLIISAILGLLGSGAGALSGILISSKLVNFRLQQIEAKLPNIDKLSDAQVEMQAELDKIFSLGSERRQKVLELQNKIDKLEDEVSDCQKDILLIKQEIAVYHKGDKN